ncbi:YbaN family protein [Paracoccus methylarcula]|uniref:DUF454 domain-containing protein n=1 Tax=Paracoccus methylarcula TaxID=72022 RepID=A0A3R7LI31_9RHOB|nr:YbaN family protein [Paracoccus methylarcula]RNF34683.1 DUF454 domain-containing protein [Paracoccus methylarcula]
MNIIWYFTGILALGLGAIGVILPVMPTVPFLLVAAWAFARSSPRLRQRILDHATYGPYVRAWQERGAIGRTAKLWAVAAMSTGVAMAIWIGLPLWLVAMQITICAAVGLYVVTRPET